MQQCPNCGHPNRAGVVFCENCGASLIGKMPLDTKSLGTATNEEKADIGVDSSVLTDVKVQGISSFTEGDMLRLEIEGSPEPVILEPKAEAIFGRRDPATGAMPDIDLTPFAGYRMGVSRRHAAIRQSSEQGLDLWDLGSSNGTYLNGQRLNAHRAYRLHNGDEIRLGQMMIRISFESGEIKKPLETKKKETPAAPTDVKTEAPAPAEPEPAVPTNGKAEATPDKAEPQTSVETAAKPATAPATSEAKESEVKPAAPEIETVTLSENATSIAKTELKTQVDAETPEKPAPEAKAEPPVDAKAPAVEEKPAEPEEPKASQDDKKDSLTKDDSSNEKRD